MSYRIEDEPQPGRLTHLAVNPVWPLLAVMFGGAGVSWVWFAVNGFAVGSPSRRRELSWVIGGFLGSVGIVVAILALYADGVVREGLGLQYALLVLTVWKLAVSYWLYTLQSRSFGLYQYFGGTVRNGLLVVFAAAILRPKFLGALPSFLVAILR